MKPAELTIRGSNETAVYACRACGSLHSPGIYVVNSEDAHAAARRAAENCCEPRKCGDCGIEIGKSRARCERCALVFRLKAARRTELDPLDRTAVFSPGVGGSWGDGYSGSFAELKSYCEDAGRALPAYVHPCVPQPLEIDPEGVIEQAVDDMHEGAADEIVDREELVRFLQAWNAKQSCVGYHPDVSRIVVLDEEACRTLLGGDLER